MESKLLRHLRSLPAWLIPVLAIFSTALLWMNESALDRFTDNPQLWLGVIITVVLWILVLVMGAVSLRLRRMSRQFETLRSRLEIEGTDLSLADGPTSPPGIRHLPAWLVLVVALLTTGVVWYDESSLLAFTSEPRLWLGIGISVVLWVMVMVNAVNRFVARRADSQMKASRRRESLLLEMFQSLQVMISASSSDGSRSRFNSYYQLLTGRSEDKLKDRGWLECIHPDDREQCIGTIVNHEPRRGEHLELEYTMIASDGEHCWIREFLVPRFGADGSLLEYIASATDITAYVADETEHEALVEELRNEAKRLRGESAMVAEERDELAKRVTTAEREAGDAKVALAGTEEKLNGVRKESQQVSSELKTAIKERETSRAEAERATTAMTKLERTVQNVQAGEQTLREELEKARADLDAAGKQVAESRADLERATTATGKLEQAAASSEATEQALREEIKQGQEELKTASQEQQAAKAETKKKLASVSSIEKKIETLKASEQSLQAQIKSDEENHAKSRTESNDARRKASQHRAKINRLTTRCKELEGQLAATGKDRDQFAAAAEKSAAAQSGKRNAPASRSAPSAAGNGTGRGLDDELSSELRLALSSVARINEQLCDSSLDETQRTFIENAQASVDAIAALIDEAVGRTDASETRKDKLSIRAFDLRAAAKGVCDIVQPAAEHRGVGLHCNVDSAVPPLISTDPVRLRQVLMYLLNSAIRIVDDGELGLRITADGITDSHATMRFEIRHANARIDADVLEETFSLNKAEPKNGSEPARQQAARAWQLISEMKGQFAFELPETGGFRIWFNLTLTKLAAARNQDKAEPDAPPKPAKRSKPVDPPSVPLAATAPAPETRKPAPKAAADAPSRPSSGDRTAPRLPQEMLDCNLGPVIELGADSVRVQCSKVPKGAAKIDLDTGDVRLKLPAEVLSSDRMGVRKFSVVFRFTSVTAEQRRQIMQIVFAHRKGATMLPLDSSDGKPD